MEKSKALNEKFRKAGKMVDQGLMREQGRVLGRRDLGRGGGYYLTYRAAFVFEYFTKLDDEVARCNLCEVDGKTTVYSYRKSNFKMMLLHLDRQHALIP
jgi:hypothetical protein